VNNSWNKVEVSRHQIFKLVANKNLSHIQLHLPSFAVVVLKQIIWSMLRNKQNWFEFNVAFSCKMSMSKGVFIVFCNWFVKGEIFFVSDLILWSEPNCFYIINQLPIPDCLSDSLLFLFFRLFRLSFSFRILACFLYFNIFSGFFLFIFCFCRTSFLSLIGFYINIFFIKILVWYLFVSVYIVVIVFFVNLLCDIFANPKINWVIDELRISFH